MAIASGAPGRRSAPDRPQDSARHRQGAVRVVTRWQRQTPPTVAGFRCREACDPATRSARPAGHPGGRTHHARAQGGLWPVSGVPTRAGPPPSSARVSAGVQVVCGHTGTARRPVRSTWRLSQGVAGGALHAVYGVSVRRHVGSADHGGGLGGARAEGSARRRGGWRPVAVRPCATPGGRAGRGWCPRRRVVPSRPLTTHWSRHQQPQRGTSEGCWCGSPRALGAAPGEEKPRRPAGVVAR